MIRATYILHERLDSRCHMNGRRKCDAYFVAFDCPPDEYNPERHEWICRHEIKRGTRFTMPASYPDKPTARRAGNLT